MTFLTIQLPVIGQANSTEDPKIVSSLTALASWANGNIDGSNVAAAFAQSAGVNTGSQVVKGATNIATSSTSSTTYTTLSTPDQVTGIVLPTNGLIRVWYQATWQESVAGAARAAIFVGSNQLMTAGAGATPVAQNAAVGDLGSPNINRPLSTFWGGLDSTDSSATSYTGDVTTGQVVSTGSNGGPCDIFAAAGTYAVSVQFKASSGSVTASNRKLWVQALSFA